MDEDARQVVAGLRQAVSASGLTQAAFARALGTSPSRLSTYLSGATDPSARLVVRARRIADGLQRASAAGFMSAPDTSLAVRSALRQADVPRAWRMLLQGRDHLRLVLRADDVRLQGAWQAQPASTGSPQWDALLAAVAAHEYELLELSAPRWTGVAVLQEPWRPAHPFLTHDRVAQLTPSWLGERNIFIPERDLVSA